MATLFKWSNLLPQQLNKAFTAADTRVLYYQPEALVAGADLALRYFFQVPSGMKATIVKASVISQGAAVGIDDSNTVVLTINNGSNAIVTKTYNSTVTFPLTRESGDLGALSSTYKVLTAGSFLGFTVTQGATADLPLFAFQVEYTLTPA